MLFSSDRQFQHNAPRTLGDRTYQDGTSWIHHSEGCIMKNQSEYIGMSDRILFFDGYSGLFLLKNAFFLPRLLQTLRTVKCRHHPELLAKCHEVTCSTTEVLFNVHFDDNSCSQDKLPVRYGGLVFRTATDLALPAFMSSRAASNGLVNDIFHQPTNTPEDNDEVRV